MTNLHEIIDSSSVIVNGYALQKVEKGVRVVNIHKPTHVAVFSDRGELLETSMDDIELHPAIHQGKLCGNVSEMVGTER